MAKGKDRSTNIFVFVLALIIAGIVAYLAGPILVFLLGGHK